MSGDMRADIAAVIESALRDRGWLDSGDAKDAAREIAPLITVRVRAAQAEAWDEGHRTYRRLGPDNCECAAYNESECGCGEYGSNVITPNPYRPGPRA